MGVFIILSSLGLWLQIKSGATLRDLGFPALFAVTTILTLLGFIAVMLVNRHPELPIGRIWFGLIMVWAADVFSFGYAYYGLIVQPGSLPGAQAALVWQAWTGAPFALFLFTLLILLFPNGRPLTSRWGRLTRLLYATMVTYLVLDALEPGPLEVLPAIDNPLGVSSAWTFLGPLHTLAIFLGVACVLAAAVSLILRWRRATGEERQQLKWFAYAAAYTAVTLSLVLYGEIASDERMLTIGLFLHPLSLIFLLVSTATAIFKYRLYDIDIIIRRTLSYAVLSGILVAIYYGAVVMLQYLFDAVIGQPNSPLITVLSTLAIAALFTPLRSLTQEWIDRRFYRTRYDADKTLADFAAIARDEVEISILSARLLSVVMETVQPEDVQLLLKIPAERQ